MSETTVVYQDPRRGVPPVPGEIPRARIWVFSFPDPEVARTWGQDRNVPEKCWDQKEKRLVLREPFLSLAYSLPKAPKEILEKRIRS